LKTTVLSSVFIIAVIFASCKKGHTPARPATPSGRTIKFILYTEEDLSADDHNITFSLFIKSGRIVLLDSAIAVMKVKNIPTANKPLIFEKKVYNDNSTLTAGIEYNIENVGTSKYLDSLQAGEQFKTIDFSFR
jgi:hypothetical protein